MTTWTNTAISKKHRNTRGKYWEETFEIAGVGGDIGGTLTVNSLKKIINAHASASVNLAALSTKVLNNTVVLTYTDPTSDHTVYITVFGIRN